MKTFFSLISVTINANLNEKIGIGLIMSNGEQSIFKVSYPKINILKGLIPASNYNILRNYFKHLNDAIMPKIDEYELNVNENTTNKWLKESYFSYLNRYSNNLVNFSEPRVIELPLNQESFKKIFNSYIFEYEDAVTSIYKIDDIILDVKSNLFPKIENSVNINVEVSPKDFKELITPVDINFIGENGVIVAGQTIEFDKRVYNLENDLTRFISFTKAVDYSRKNRGKYFLIGKEPNKNEYYQNHKIWKHVKDSHLVDYIDISDIERISDYISEKNVKPFFDKD